MKLLVSAANAVGFVAAAKVTLFAGLLAATTSRAYGFAPSPSYSRPLACHYGAVGVQSGPRQTESNVGWCLHSAKDAGDRAEALQSSLPSSKTLGYEDSDGASKGIVSFLTNLVNSVAKTANTAADRAGTVQASGSAVATAKNAPKSAEELLQRLRDDYVVNNYLWTGRLDLDCFADDCTFTDPTISFTGVDKYVTNMQNLVPLVERYCQNEESRLLEIKLSEEYVEARWNMVGELNGIWWKPKIDVIGKTRFWFRKDDSDGVYQIFFYDEAWEMPAYKALLQLVTPAGTVGNGASSLD